MKNIAIVGAGYVGLVTGVCFAQKGNFVVMVENNLEKIDSLLKGQVPFYEPGLDLLLTKAIKEEKIIFVDNISKALNYNPEVLFSCVGTPSNDDGSADLTYVWQVAHEVSKVLNNYIVFVNKSTVPVGTVKMVENIIKKEFLRRNLNLNFNVISNPEFLKEGDALSDFLYPDRIVIGTDSEKAKNILLELYKPFLKSEEDFLVMSPESAELTKYASNAMLATRISFINQLALLADKVGADIVQVKAGMSKDRRIGSAFLNAGIGYGGSCFPKDVKALVYTGKVYNKNMSLVNEVENVNNYLREAFVKRILTHYQDHLKHKKIGIWGFAFKPETDDIRSAPSIDIIEKLLSLGAVISGYDPVACENIKNIFGNKINYFNNSKDLLSWSDSLVILTDWKEFLSYKPEEFLVLKDKVIFDGRNCFDPIEMASVGIEYNTIGRNSIKNNLNLFSSYKTKSLELV